jgi:hypothetical protein
MAMKRTRDEAIQAAAEIYAHWLATEGTAIIAAQAERERQSA